MVPPHLRSILPPSNKEKHMLQVELPDSAALRPAGWLVKSSSPNPPHEAMDWKHLGQCLAIFSAAGSGSFQSGRQTENVAGTQPLGPSRGYGSATLRWGTASCVFPRLPAGHDGRKLGVAGGAGIDSTFPTQVELCCWGKGGETALTRLAVLHFLFRNTTRRRPIFTVSDPAFRQRGWDVERED